MDVLGYIRSTTMATSLKLEHWTALIATHPNLAAAEDEIGINPFTKKPHLYKVHPGTARVVVSGVEAGLMHWADDGSNRIVVYGTAAVVGELADRIARMLGGAFVPHA